MYPLVLKGEVDLSNLQQGAFCKGHFTRPSSWNVLVNVTNTSPLLNLNGPIPKPLR